MRSIGRPIVGVLIICVQAIFPAPHRLAKRYVLSTRGWDRCVLRWAFRDPFRLFAGERDFRMAKDAVTTAVRAWEAQSDGGLLLIDVSPAFDAPQGSPGRPQYVDIDVLFARGVHGDAETFDGAGGMVAHTTYPVHGLVHFDAGERWTVGDGTQRQTNDSKNLVDLRYVALHELGHALGLKHSSHYKSIMNAYYSTTGMPRLSRDDAQGLRERFAHCTPRANTNLLHHEDSSRQLSRSLL